MMPGFSDVTELGLLRLLFQNDASGVAGVGDAGGLRGSVSAGSLFVALHSADPGEAGTGATSELAFAGYARVIVVRSAAGWTVSQAGDGKGQVVNAAAVSFGQNTGSNVTATHWSLVEALTGASDIILSGQLVDNLSAPITVTIATGSTASFDPGQLLCKLD
jgi:hypothetical protein